MEQKPSFEAIIFDLDGVITQTASIHNKAWKQMFNRVLLDYYQLINKPFREFTHQDYLQYVDGKPRYEGVASFLESRSIKLPLGDPSDGSNEQTICGLGNRKNQLFHEIVTKGGVEVFHSTIKLIKNLKTHNIRIGVASSSKNTGVILDSVGIADLFETCVDGVISAELGLNGKPEPDIFTTACDRLDVPYYRAVIVEDAISGVQAGRNGNFGLVIGVARENNEQELIQNGADIVVSDLIELDYVHIEEWFAVGLVKDQWTLQYNDYSPQQEGTREALLTIGNGFFGTRGAMEESSANDTNYPGTYIAGVYNRLKSKVANKEIENEDFVNCPNWLLTSFKLGNGKWFDLNQSTILKCERWLDFRDGVLHKRMVVKDDIGRETLVESARLASMAQPHLAAMKYCITPLNYEGTISLRTGINGDIINYGVKRYRQLKSKHLQPVSEGVESDVGFLLMQTNQSKIQISEAFRLNVLSGEQQITPEFKWQMKPGQVFTTFTQEVNQRESVCLQKFVAIYTSREVKNPLKSAQAALKLTNDYKGISHESATAWKNLWDEIDIQVEGDRLGQKMLRLNLYHSMVTASPNTIGLDVGIPARGLHGESYRGHIFWDELYILPLYLIHLPQIARAVLLYRYNRLNAARKYAQEHGYNGAMFPWQSGSDGREETQQVHLNPLSGEWGPDYSSLQRHVSLAIAYNLWQYYWITQDDEFLAQYGAELFLEICRFWGSIAHQNPQTRRYEINKVMGPDEYHEKYPNAKTGGLRNNSYTNLMAAWVLNHAFVILEALDEQAKEQVCSKIHLNADELALWKEITERIHIPISPQGIIEQFEGYFNLEELDWEEYKQKYDDITRMDRILKAEGKTPDNYKVTKQADTLMCFYNLSSETVTGILQNAGYEVTLDMLQKNFSYYLPRTSHGSTLSRVVHSHLAQKIGNTNLGWQYFREALLSDYMDIQDGTTSEGIHAGLMASSAILAICNFAGLNLGEEFLHLVPTLPDAWRKLSFNLRFRGKRYYFIVTHQQVKIKLHDDAPQGTALYVWDHLIQIKPGEWKTITI